ncbi:mandelate racemase/muconate lactonizing enzyme family protein [Rubrobacter taiwanensis]|uniref:Mandelate racemase/muconate lactonizing enzyme family protein n=1 Tax=Rubrobacter taiwanensis TaxID=185139 RepID=A0A4R1BRL7_9ACTN|nr:mandelate racemase/muconate lactonizing enzyme family protein [Rubrobacter taiwanensis]TCJ19855.1 mandelate racemase/muconate lactonizing enzyme family protein [Rubrobacter taiwanensis]
MAGGRARLITELIEMLRRCGDAEIVRWRMSARRKMEGGWMEIEHIETAYYRLPLETMGDAGHGAIDSEELITLKLHAGGLTGHGYAYTIGRGGRAIKALVDYDLVPLLLGRDATDIRGLWDLMWQRLLYVGRGGLASFAAAAVDVALWDLYGLREEKPLYALFGAESREIPAYGSGVDLPKSLDELLAQTEGFLERGFPGVKVKVGREDPKEDEARIKAVRKLIGDDTDLMVDANMAWSAKEALERGRRLEQYNLYWYEEPTIPEDVSGYARLVRELDVPIAAGESLHSPHEFRRYVEEGAVGVVQIDPITNGGITASLEALRLADKAGLATSSHYTDELSAHLLCASENPVYLEKHAFALDAYLEEPQRVVNGHVRPAETPGTGMRFDERALKPYRG